ncbi:MAG: cyclic nucleotide-binding domain-containing protein [Deltaproteobacteria bacterium]|nr:MAG: cyclic nucleotide-binding domain-containing protein [Deltaproteobacteria bacterium]
MAEFKPFGNPSEDATPSEQSPTEQAEPQPQEQEPVEEEAAWPDVTSPEEELIEDVILGSTEIEVFDEAHTPLNILQASQLCGQLPESILEPVSRHLKLLRFSAGDSVVRQGEIAEQLLFVAEGDIQTTHREPEYGLDYRGPERTVGDEISLASVWLGDAHHYSVKAHTDAQFYAIDREVLKDLSMAYPRLQQTIADGMARHLFREQSLQPIPVVDLSRLRLDESLLNMFPRHVINNHKVLPLMERSGVLAVGFVDMNNLYAVDDVKRLAHGKRVNPIPLDQASFERYYRTTVSPLLDRREGRKTYDDQWFSALKRKTYESISVEETMERVSHDKRGKQVPGEMVIQWVNRLVGEALDLMASDIHIEPGENEMVVRYRVDGRLKKRPETLDMRFHGPIVSRLKIHGHMDIAERRQAQDGRLRLFYDNRPIDFRLSTIPTHYGEKLVLRILDPTSILIELERLILHEPTLQAVRWMIEQPQGIVLVAGPTGSGKTTTIYSTLLHRREDEVNIVTIEDPIEYTVDRIAQVQVNDLANVSFANSIRHFLRQDPDIIVVGETRDPVTAATALEAALTGHLVLSTIHANSALGTLVRLREMGIESFLLANTVTGLISQRLVRRVCSRCREVTKYHRNLIVPLGLFPKENAPEYFEFYKGKGCMHCNYLGFRGRVGAFEVLRVDESLRPLIAAGADTSQLRQMALQSGHLSLMKDYCRYLLTQGLTTPEEVIRILFIEDNRSDPTEQAAV